ncbi:MAG: JAB domain-containing protein [Aureispira sp.]
MDINLTPAEKIKILNSDDLYHVMQRILLRENKIDQNREHFWIVGLESNNRILFIELISLGTVNRTIVEPMEVFSLALQKRAVNIILCHNHPSGSLKPSPEDKDVTDRLIQAGRIVNMPVLDHMIISERSYLSFDDNGLMKELSQSTKYVPSYELVERIRREAELKSQRALLEARALMKEKIKEADWKAKIIIAKELKRDGMEDERITALTKLPLEEVQALNVRRRK